MRKHLIIILFILLNSLIVFLPVDIVRGDPNPSGGNIVGDTVYWENSYANLSVYPHTSNTSIIRQKQWANLTWKESDNVIDVAFRFNDSLSYGKIWRWTGDSWISVSMSHTEYGGKHYYYYAGFNVVQDTTYRFKWEYDVIANTSGKWWLFAKLNEHTVQQALDNNWYVALDPWWNAGWARCVHIKIDNTHIDATLTNFPILVNISAELSQHCNDGDSVRFVNLANDTEYAFEFDNNETFDGATYNLAWVNITSISSSSGTFFNMYFDNVGASDGQDSDGVWDINFTTVFHFSDRGSSDVVDSTSNSNNGVTDGNFTDDDGLVGKANYINEGAAVIDIFEMDENTDVTVEFLFKKTPDNNFRLSSTDNGGGGYVAVSNVLGSGNHIIGMTYDPVVESESSVVYNDGWQYSQFVIDRTAGRQYLYTNLTSDDDDDISGSSSFHYSGKMAIGARYIATIGRTSIGYLDEFRLSDCVRSSAWRKATYHAMMQTAGFITFGSVVYSATSVTNTTTEISNTTATLNGYIADIAGMAGNYDCGFWYGTNSNLVEGTYDTNVTVGTYSPDTEFSHDVTSLINTTDYYVRAWISNATFWATGSMDNFTTNGGLPIFSNVFPSNNSNVDINIDLSVNIVDPDGDLFDWTMEIQPDIGDNSGNDETNGTKTCTITPTHNTEYIWYVNCTDGYNWTNASYVFTAIVTYVAVPTNGTSTYHTGVNYLNITWDNNSGVSETYRTDSYIVVQRNDTYATSATQSGNWIRQNGSAAFLNISWSETSGGYFTIFGYNSSANIYSYNNATPLGLDIPWGALALSCFNESNPADAIGFDIEISNSTFTVTYAATNLTNIHYIDMEDIPYGDGTIFLVSNSSYETRSYTYDINQNAFYNLVFYLPLALPIDPDENITYAEDYVIHVVGPATEYGVDPPIEGSEVIIRKYITTTGQYETVGVYVTSADGTFTVSLLPNNLYSFNISATGYYDTVESWMPVEIVFEGDRHHTFRLTPLTGEDVPTDEYDIFWDTITFTGTMNDIDGLNGTITITYSDSNSSTTNTQIYIYEYWNGTETLIATITNTSENSFTYTTGVINTTRQHTAKLFFNNTANFDATSPVTIIINNINFWSERIPFDFEARVRSIFGDAGFVYAAAISASLAIMALVMFGPHNTGIGILACGFTLAFTNALFTMLFTGSFNVLLTIYTPIVIVIGAMYVLIKDPGGHL